MLWAASIKYADLNWFEPVGKLSAHFTGGLTANHIPSLVASVALRVITNSVLSGFGPVIPITGLIPFWAVRWQTAATVSNCFLICVQWLTNSLSH